MTHQHVVFDAKSRRDPTGTRLIRSAFRNDAERRLQRVKNQTRQALKEGVLGLGTTVLGLSPERRLAMFYEWANSMVYSEFVDNGGQWTRQYIRSAFAKGLGDARKEMRADSSYLPFDVDGVYQQLTIGELQGIADAVVQRVNRLAGNSIVRKDSSGLLAQILVRDINKIGLNRLRLLANTLTVRAYNDAKLNAYLGLGVQRVGLLPELLPAKDRRARKRIVRDAEIEITLPAIPQDLQEAMATRDPVLLNQQRYADLGVGSVELKTAEDDAVCEDCQAIADDGPYLIEDVIGVLPVHGNCRCSWLPYGDPRLDENDE